MLTITDEQREELKKWAQSRTLPAGDVFRARLILALAEGQTYEQIKASLQTTAPTISRWKQRFEHNGLAGLDARHKRAATADAAVQARIARKTQQKPTDGSTHWTCRKMAAALGLSKSTVQRVWTQMRLKPHRLDGYRASNDPRFEEKATDINVTHSLQPRGAVFANGLSEALHAYGLPSSARIVRNFTVPDWEQRRLVTDLLQCANPPIDPVKNRVAVLEFGGHSPTWHTLFKRGRHRSGAATRGVDILYSGQ